MFRNVVNILQNVQIFQIFSSYTMVHALIYGLRSCMSHLNWHSNTQSTQSQITGTTVHLTDVPTHLVPTFVCVPKYAASACALSYSGPAYFL